MRAVVTWKTENFALSVATNHHGRGVHDSTKGIGSSHSTLQREVNGKCPAQQIGHVSRSKTCLVRRFPTAPSPRQCQNKTVESRINQVNQTHPSISWGCRCGCPWWTPGRGRGGRRGFGDGSRGTMVEAHDKRQSVHPQTTHHSFRSREERQSVHP